MSAFWKWLSRFAAENSAFMHPTYREKVLAQAAWNAALGEVAKMLDARVKEFDGMIKTAPLTPRGVQLNEDCARELDHQAAAIRAMIEK